MSITKVPAGYVGVKYNMNGGVEGDVLDQGWHFKSPTVKVTLYTVGIEQSYLTSGKNGDSPDNDSFSASSSEGKSIQIDLTYTYNYQHDKVSEVFTKFKGQSGKTVRDSFIKPNIISWTKEVIARYKVSDVLGEKRADVNAALTKYLADKFVQHEDLDVGEVDEALPHQVVQAAGAGEEDIDALLEGRDLRGLAHAAKDHTNGRERIYLEDYVGTFLKKYFSAPEGRAAMLFGEFKWADGISYFFIRSAAAIHTMEPAPDHLVFDDAVWTEVHDVMEKYFKNQQILGWALSLPGYGEDLNEQIIRAHLNHFGGNDKTLFRVNGQEKEETFYTYEGGTLRSTGGFYIYYEKNEPMQSYLIDQNQNRSIENGESVPDRAVSDFRKMIEEKSGEEPEQAGNSSPVLRLLTSIRPRMHILVSPIYRKAYG